MSEPSTSDRLIRSASKELLSDVLPSVLSAARQVGDDDLADWVRLEMSGYSSDNPAMTEDIVVPEYRTVAGRHIDRIRGPIEIQDDRLTFLDTDRLRFGVGTLESLTERDDSIQVDKSAGMKVLRENFDVDPVAYVFSPESVGGVLDAIRSRLIDMLEDRRDALDEAALTPAQIPGEEEIESFFIDHVIGLIVGVLSIVIGGFLLWYFGWVGGGG